MIKQLLATYASISIIGMSKNAGKTTVLNHILSQAKDTIGVTSIGLDGETFDTISELLKPKIIVKKNTIIATALECLEKSTAVVDILETTTMNTPLGTIIIGRVLKEGTILLAGPSTNRGLKTVKEKLTHYKVSNILIDGALFRKSIAAYDVSEAVVIASGASYHPNMDRVVHDTKKLIDWFSLPQYDGVHKDTFLHSNHSCIVSENKTVKLDQDNPMKDLETVIQYFSKDITTWYVHGAFTNKMIEAMIEHRHKVSHIDLIIRDASCILSDYALFSKLKHLPVRISLLHKTTVALVTVNPVAPGLYTFNKDEFYKKMQEKITLPVINVVEKRSDEIE